MDSIRQLNIFYSTFIIFFNIIILFVRLNDSATIGDLKIACGIKYIPTNQDMCLSDVPDLCTSIILNCNDFPNEEAFDNFMLSQAKVPVFLIEDSVPFENWVSKFTLNAQEIEDYKAKIKKYNLAGIFFDNMYSTQLPEVSEVMSAGMPVFFNALKSAYSDQNTPMLFGVVMPFYRQIIEKGFTYSSLDETIDVYLVNSTNYYTKCTNVGGSLVPPYAIKTTADTINSLFNANLFSMTKTKVIMTIQLSVKDGNTNEEMSYGKACSRCPGVVVCQDSIKSIYLKAQIITNSSFSGAYVRYANTDDTQGQCYCGNRIPFPGLTTISAGLQGKSLEFIYCISFGVPGIYRPNDNCVEECPNCLLSQSVPSHPFLPKPANQSDSPLDVPPTDNPN